MHGLDLPPRPRILIVALRRLGDVLLTTPLIRSVRRAFADATVDVLVFADTAGILEGNPDVDHCLTLPTRARVAESLAMATRLWRRYDLAIATQAGDRPTLYAALAGRRRAGMVEPRFIGTLKRLLLDRALPLVAGAHRVEEMLALARLIGVAPVPEIVPPRPGVLPDALPAAYAVLHAAPMYVYKSWTGAGWRALARHLGARGLGVIATGGPAAAERAYLDAVFAGLPAVRRLDAALSWSALTALLARARVFVGPDTSVTHLAAAAGCPVVALFGPTDPRLWAPWPAGGLTMPWAPSAAVQMRGNVRLLQHPMPCQPCQEEGCLRRLDSYSLCLDRLSPQAVIAAVDAALAQPPAGSN